MQVSFSIVSSSSTSFSFDPQIILIINENRLYFLGETCKLTKGGNWIFKTKRVNLCTILSTPRTSDFQLKLNLTLTIDAVDKREIQLVFINLLRFLSEKLNLYLTICLQLMKQDIAAPVLQSCGLVKPYQRKKVLKKYVSLVRLKFNVNNR